MERDKMEQMTINNKFSLLLAEKRMREKRNIPIREISEQTGIARKTLIAWANNDVTRLDARVLDALCKYFKVSIEELIQFIPDEPGQ
jgi:putative transcriptional regulator